MTTPQQPNQHPQALPELATYLAIQHQADQEAVAAQTAAGLSILWPILKFSDLATSTQPWLHATTLEIEKGYQASVSLGMQFAQQTLWAIDPTAGPIHPLPIPFPVQKVQTSMQVTGPGAIKGATRVIALGDQSLTDGVERQVMGNAKDGSTGAGVKQATQGGRDAVIQSTQLADVVPESTLVQKRHSNTIGYARFTDSNPCFFCGMLASRGAVYKENSFQESSKAFGNNIAAVHDHCKCSLRPVFRTQDSMDDRADFFKGQWDKLTNGLSGRQAMNSFRKGYVAPPPYESSPTVDLGAVRANRDRLVDLGFADDSPQVQFYNDMIDKLTG